MKCRSFFLAAFVAMIFTPHTTDAALTLPLSYTFNAAGNVAETKTMTESWSPYWWVHTGARLIIANGIGATLSGNLSPTDPWYELYYLRDKTVYESGTKPQNAFKMFFRHAVYNVSTQIYINRVADNLSLRANRLPYTGQFLYARYKDSQNFYLAGLRADGYLVIKKRVNGTYRDLTSKKLLPGTFNIDTNPNLIPKNKWIGLKLIVTDSEDGVPNLALFTDIGKTGTWTLGISAADDPAKYGNAIKVPGYVGVQSDFGDVQFDDFKLQDARAGNTAPPAYSKSAYDTAVLQDTPRLYLPMRSPNSGIELDLTGNGNDGMYMGESTRTTTMPNGDPASVFNGNSYVTVPAIPALSIPTTGKLTIESWIRADTLRFPLDSSESFVDWMGKCHVASPTCEWEMRMYGSDSLDRPGRISAYAFNSSAGMGSGAAWQPANAVIQSGEWLHVVAQYQTLSTPDGCDSTHPGTITIWVNGVQQSFIDHRPTGCMSQYDVTPKTGSSPLIIGTMAYNYWFNGAIGKVAVYDTLLTEQQISNHYRAMTGRTPSGTCGITCTIP